MSTSFLVATLTFLALNQPTLCLVLSIVCQAYAALAPHCSSIASPQAWLSTLFCEPWVTGGLSTDSLDAMANPFLPEAPLPPPVNEHQASPEQDLVYSDDPLPMTEREAFPISKVNYGPLYFFPFPM